MKSGGRRLVISLCGALGSGLYTKGGDIDIGLFSGDMTREKAKKILEDGLSEKHQGISIDFWRTYIPLRHLEIVAEALSSGEMDLSRYHGNILTHFFPTSYSKSRKTAY